ncbi:MAG: 2-oxoacid:ferredoxin oxidoreductase subunit beta, partial [Deltaproteobacteria bacterium]|nr:2-oxoacid:ferredoxin oxidoreductase subunit beta [Deltaproteobacteria bacterium]
MVQPTTFNTREGPNWCPGCGNFGLQSALKKALFELGLPPHRVCLSTGIGCSSKIAHWVQAYGFHGLHGRALPVAAGIKLANHDLTVIAEGGDGDGFSEGIGHFIHACRRNLDLTYIVHNNGVFSLTTGQASATGAQG